MEASDFPHEMQSDASDGGALPSACKWASVPAWTVWYGRQGIKTTETSREGTKSQVLDLSLFCPNCERQNTINRLEISVADLELLHSLRPSPERLVDD